MPADKILITGGLGFIGLEVARALVQSGHSVLLFDNLNPQIHGAIPDLALLPLLKHSSVEVLRGEVSSSSDWARALQPSSGKVGCVIHLAAETGTGQSMYQISRYTATNVGGTAAFLDYLANHRHHVSKIILASSRAVYGEGPYSCHHCGIVYPPPRFPTQLKSSQWQPLCPHCLGTIEATATREDMKTSPASIYAATKLAQEDLVRVAAKALGIASVIYRLQNVYGEGQSLRNPYTGILSIFTNQLRLGKPIALYEDGQESRDFVHVSDVSRAVAMGLHSDRAEGLTLNVGSGHATSVEKIALLLQDRLGSAAKPVVSGQYRLGDIRHGFADLTAARRCLGFVPEINLEQGLDRFVSWAKIQPLEADNLHLASEELVHRGLMSGHETTKAASV